MWRTSFAEMSLSLMVLSACSGIENGIVDKDEVEIEYGEDCNVDLATAAAAPEDRPVAVCSVSSSVVAPIQDTVTFYGEESYDPNGGDIMRYEWNLVETPLGRPRPLDGTGPNREDFAPQLAGVYVAELVVINDHCVASEPCTTTVSADPYGDLWIELTWSEPGDDMDLHLLLDDAAMRDFAGDCYFSNCTPTWNDVDWGVSGDTTDDPQLDLDDITETGPENINIESPAPATYTVVVHDYPGSVFEGANEVRVRIHLGGTLAYDETKTISGEDSETSFARIEWPTGSVQSL